MGYIFLACIIISNVVWAFEPPVRRPEVKSPEEARREVEEFKETIQDHEAYDAEKLRSMKEMLQQEDSSSGISLVEKQLLDEKINAIDRELLTRVSSGPPVETPIKKGEVSLDTGEYRGPEEIVEDLTRLSQDVTRNGPEILRQLDILTREVTTLSPGNESFDTQLASHESLQRAINKLNEARRFIDQTTNTTVKQKFRQTQDLLVSRQEKLFETMLRNQTQEAKDASRVAGRSIWSRLLDAIKSLFSLSSRSFRLRQNLSNDLTSVYKELLRLPTAISEIQTRVNALRDRYNQQHENLQEALQRNISSLTSSELQTLKQELATMLDINKFYETEANQVLEQYNEELRTRVNQFREQANGVVASWNSRIIAQRGGKPRYSSLYEQFKQDLSSALKLDVANYSFKQEPGKGWVPQTLGFDSYTALLDAPSSEIAQRFQEASSLENKGKPGYWVARELEILLRDPISRENFRALLDADGLLDGKPKGPERVNALQLDEAVRKPLTDFLANTNDIFASMTMNVNIAPPDFAVTQKAIQNKVAAIDARLRQVGSSSSGGISIDLGS
jgi:hypothetical protein